MLNPHYIVGFVDGEGCFSVSLNKNGNRLPEVRLIFKIELREDDEPLLHEIQKVLDCGIIYRWEYARYAKWRPHVKLKVSNFTDISSKVIPFFQRYPLQAKKRLQFETFCQVAELIRSKQHLTLEGVMQVKALKHKDSRSALDALATWGAPEITRAQSPPVKPWKSWVPDVWASSRPKVSKMIGVKS